MNTNKVSTDNIVAVREKFAYKLAFWISKG